MNRIPTKKRASSFYLCRKQSGGQMCIIAFIEDHNAIDRIIRHLKLTFAAERPPPPQAWPHLLIAAEERAEYL
jgi:hypothetical protein